MGNDFLERQQKQNGAGTKLLSKDEFLTIDEFALKFSFMDKNYGKTFKVICLHARRYRNYNIRHIVMIKKI